MCRHGDESYFLRICHRHFFNKCKYLPAICHQHVIKSGIHFFYPLGQPKVTAGRDNCFHTCCQSVPTFQIQKNKTTENNVFYWRDYGLAVWIIDDTCLVFLYFYISIRWFISLVLSLLHIQEEIEDLQVFGLHQRR